MSKREHDILYVKYSGKRFGVMQEEELIVAANAIMFKISVITGWQIPDDETYQDSLIAELVSKFTEEYDDMTASEILFAMRNYSKKVEDFGKAININLIDKVVDYYRIDREKLSMIEEGQRTQEQFIYSDEELDNVMRETAQTAYSWYLLGHKSNIEWNKAILYKDGIIKEGQSVKEYFEKAHQAGVTEIYKKEKP